MVIRGKIENIPWLAELEELQKKFENTEPLDYSKIEEELKTYIVELDPDPSSVGLSSLNKKISKVDGYMSRVVTTLMNAIANESKFNFLFSDICELYNKHLRVQLRQKEIASLSNQNLRQAAAEDKIIDIGKLKFVVEKMLNAAKNHTKMCREKLGSLETTNKNISRQITVIQTQLEVGEIERKINRRDNNF